MISNEAVLSRAPGVVGADVNELHVLLNDDLKYLGLDTVGQRVWELLAAPNTLDGLVAALTQEYDVDPVQCRADVVPFLQILVDNHLLQVG